MDALHINKCRAYTMVEIALVLLIAGLLYGMLRPAYTHIMDEEGTKAAIGEITDIEYKIDEFKKNNGHYPDSLDEVFSPVPLDPWGNPYQFLNIIDNPHKSKGKLRKDKNLVPINSDYDLFSMGPDGKSTSAITANISHDDIVRGRNGSFVGLASNY